MKAMPIDPATVLRDAGSMGSAELMQARRVPQKGSSSAGNEGDVYTSHRAPAVMQEVVAECMAPQLGNRG